MDGNRTTDTRINTNFRTLGDTSGGNTELMGLKDTVTKELTSSLEGMGPRTDTIREAFAKRRTLATEGSQAEQELVRMRGTEDIEEQLETNARSLADFADSRTGFTTQVTGLKYIVDSGEKRVRDLRRESESLLLQAKATEAARLDNLIAMEEEAITNARSQYQQLLFGLSGEIRAEEGMQLQREESEFNREMAISTFGLNLEQFAFDQEKFAQEFEFQRERAKQQDAQFELNYLLSRDQFEESKRQFGASYAQRERQIAQEAAAYAAEQNAEVQAEVSTSVGNMALVDNILAKLEKNTGATGPIQGRLPGNRVFKNELAQVANILTLENVEKLKGTLSNTDMEILRGASSVLGQNPEVLKDEDLKYQMQQVRGVFATNAGLEVPVKVLNPVNGEVKMYNFDKNDIQSARMQGFQVEFTDPIAGLVTPEQQFKQNNPAYIGTPGEQVLESREGYQSRTGNRFLSN